MCVLCPVVLFLVFVKNRAMLCPSLFSLSLSDTHKHTHTHTLPLSFFLVWTGKNVVRGNKTADVLSPSFLSPSLCLSLSLSLSFYFCVYNAHRLRESQQDSKELPNKYWICVFTCLDWRESIQFESYSSITPKLKFGKISKVNITH